MRRRTLSDVVGRIYEGTGSLSEWPGLLTEIRLFLSSDVATLQTFDAKTRAPGFGLTDNRSMEDLDLYNREFLSTDPRIAPAAAHLNRTMPCHLLVPPQVFDRGALVNEFLDPKGIRWAQGTIFQVDPLTSAYLVSGRPRRQGFYETDEASAQDQLIPHIARMVSLQSRLNGLEDAIANYSALVDRLAPGVVLATADSEVLTANASADHFFRHGDGLTLSFKRLAGVTSEDTARLRNAIASAASSREGGAPAPNALRMRRSSGRESLVITVLPLPRASPLHRHAHRADVLVIVNDPAAEPRIPERVLQGLGLTPAESRLAVALSAGKNLENYASEAELSKATVKSHLLSIFRKTGTNRQSELVSFLQGALSIAPFYD